jgi:aminopeptidase N/puromycin-sensitive aminopeptidase
VLLTEPSQTVPVGEGCLPWVFVNAGGRGYYRTLYPRDVLKALARDAETALSAPERLSLIADEWALVRAGRDSVANYLDLASGFGREPIADVLGVVTTRLASIDADITTTSNRPAFRRFVADLLLPAYREVGFERRAQDDEDRRSLRNVLVAGLGEIAQDAGVIARARTAVDHALQGSEPLDPILANALVRIAAAHGDERLYEALKQAAARATNPQEHNRYFFALTAFTDPVLVRRALDVTLSAEVRSQDAALYLVSFFGNEAAREPAWAFVKAHWAELEPKVTIALGDSYLVGGLAAYCSADARDDIRSFFTAHPLPSAERTLQQTLERIDNCVATQRRERPALNEWLAGR